VKLSKRFVCVRLETYENDLNKKLVRSLLGGRLANTAFVIFAPDGKTQLCKASRSPSMTFAQRGWRSQPEKGLSTTLKKISEIAKKYPNSESGSQELLPDFYSFKQALNVSAAEQRLLVFTVAAKKHRQQARKRLQTVANDTEIRGKFHYDTASNDDSNWAESIKDTSQKTGHFIIYPGQFGLSGKLMAHLPLNAKPAQIKSTLLKANRVYAAQEKPKIYASHMSEGRKQGISRENTLPRRVRQ